MPYMCRNVYTPFFIPLRERHQKTNTGQERMRKGKEGREKEREKGVERLRKVLRDCPVVLWFCYYINIIILCI